jgi:hypothetical protein
MGEKFLGPGMLTFFDLEKWKARRANHFWTENSNIVGNITANVSIPTSRPRGAATITAALFSLYGVGLTGSVEYFAVNVTVGNETSSEYVMSEYENLESYEMKWRA